MTEFELKLLRKEMIQEDDFIVLEFKEELDSWEIENAIDSIKSILNGKNIYNEIVVLTNGVTIKIVGRDRIEDLRELVKNQKATSEDIS